MIKRIGTEARQDLERFFGTKVFLDLRVKVNPDWRDNERVLDDLGVPKRTASRSERRSQNESDVETKALIPAVGQILELFRPAN